MNRFITFSSVAAAAVCLLLKTAPTATANSSNRSGQIDLTTSQYNNLRTGSNANEVRLTPRNVNSREFGKLFSLDVDGDVYAEPLYLPAVQISGKGTQEVIFIATEHDSLYAFDAGKKSAPFWHTNFTNSAMGVTSVPAQETHCPFINPEVGITSTPVIDRDSGTLFVLVRTKEEVHGAEAQYVQRLHAIDVSTGNERSGSPVTIKASVTTAAGDKLAFDPRVENPRAAIALVNGNIYLSWASSCDAGDYHGWVMAYDAHTLAQKAVFNTSPNGKQSGIWQSDTGPAADREGNLYVVTGNGDFDAVTKHDYGDTMMKLFLDRNKFLVRDYFTPHDEQVLNQKDLDLGAGGPVLLPDQDGGHPHLALVGGKDGNLFVLDRDHMGQYHEKSDDVVQVVKLPGSLHAAPAYWNEHVFVFGDNDCLHDLIMRGGNCTRARRKHGRSRSGSDAHSLSKRRQRRDCLDGQHQKLVGVSREAGGASRL